MTVRLTQREEFALLTLDRPEALNDGGQGINY